jgi:hypothetical protein
VRAGGISDAFANLEQAALDAFGEKTTPRDGERATRKHALIDALMLGIGGAGLGLGSLFARAGRGSRCA